MVRGVGCAHEEGSKNRWLSGVMNKATVSQTEHCLSLRCSIRKEEIVMMIITVI